MLDDRLSQAIAASKRSGRYAAVMALDLDNFKRINDAHGHAAGDLLLIEVARRITSCVREVDTVVRQHGLPRRFAPRSDEERSGSPLPVPFQPRNAKRLKK